MDLRTEPYLAQTSRWPAQGRHILAQFDDDSVVVYQAYSPAIGGFALRHGYFGEGFNLNRMSWIKPNFLWMMFRSAWGTRPDQEVVLAVRIARAGFDALLASAVHSTFVPEIYASQDEWRAAGAASDVRLQWDPDHHPSGVKLHRRAIQLGLRGAALARYAREWIVEIEDISPFVAEQCRHAEAMRWALLLTPHEEVYPVADAAVAARLGLAVPAAA